MPPQIRWAASEDKPDEGVDLKIHDNEYYLHSLKRNTIIPTYIAESIYRPSTGSTGGLKQRARSVDSGSALAAKGTEVQSEDATIQMLVREVSRLGMVAVSHSTILEEHKALLEDHKALREEHNSLLRELETLSKERTEHSSQIRKLEKDISDINLVQGINAAAGKEGRSSRRGSEVVGIEKRNQGGHGILIAAAAQPGNIVKVRPSRGGIPDS